MMDVFGNSGNDVFKQKGEDILTKRQEDTLAHRGNPTEDVLKNKEENDVLKHRNENIFGDQNFQFSAFPNDTDHEHIVRDRTVRTVMVSKLKIV